MHSGRWLSGADSGSNSIKMDTPLDVCAVVVVVVCPVRTDSPLPVEFGNWCLTNPTNNIRSLVAPVWQLDVTFMDTDTATIVIPLKLVGFFSTLCHIALILGEHQLHEYMSAQPSSSHTLLNLANYFAKHARLCLRTSGVPIVTMTTWNEATEHSKYSLLRALRLMWLSPIPLPSLRLFRCLPNIWRHFGWCTLYCHVRMQCRSTS